MLKVLITSSVLIAALLILRRLFRRTLSRRIQYALWGLVLLRLLVPVNLPPMDFSILTAVQPVEEKAMQRISTQPVSLPALPVFTVRQQSAVPVQLPPEQAGDRPLTDSGPVGTRGRTVPVKTLLTAGWIAGSTVAAGFLLYANLSFWRKLRRLRRRYPVESCPLQVYLVEEGLSSPCLFGLFRPAVYLTPAAVASPARLRHVLAHEQTHARHLDHIWALLRGVCLAVYWFDPLVWLAASAAKTDCELACDESALIRLGETERLPYGQTLLSLIPVGRAESPLLAATTMAAGKKQLKDRVRRIAQKPRQLAAAVTAALLLAGLVTVCAFAGGKTGGGPAESPTDPPANPPQSASDADALRALTGDELRFFNEEFFNAGGAMDEYGQLASGICNQFANPVNLYSRPEEIDLYELFYCVSEPEISDAERLAAFKVASPEEMVCPGYKLTADGMDALLLAYTGLKLDQTDRVGLEGFTYLEEYDAYYWMHGDTNYPGEIFFSCGTRERNTIRLYNGSYGARWYCVTLEEQPDGSYWFRSNQVCDRPAVPTPLPASEPETVISLKDLEPYEAPTLTVEPHVGDFTDSYEDRLENWNIDGRNVVVYRATGGNVYAAVRDGETMNVFLSEGLSEESRFITFSGLLGHDGFAVSHYGQIGPRAYGTLVDYFYFDGNDTPVLLARASTWGDMPLVLDLDGDGDDELCTDSEIFFLREGVLCRAGLEELAVGAGAAMDGWYGGTWDRYAKSLFVSGGRYSEEDGPRTIFRWVYFTGDELLLYRDEKTHHDHMVDGVDPNVPDEVVAAARAYVENEVLDLQSDGTWRHKGWQDEGYPQETYDDWRIERIARSCVQTVGDTVIEGWTFNYELHVVDPENVVLAGGKYFTEDDWVSPGYPNCDWLFFRVEAEQRVFLWHDMINDMSPDSQRFREYLSRNAAQFVSDTQTGTGRST